MSVFVLKIIAILSMVFDHTGYILYHHFSWMNYVGRLAFPIFAFLLTEGYTHTKNLKKYFLRLFIFAILSQIPYTLFQKAIGIELNLNIFFTLLLGLLVIYIYETVSQKWIGLLFAIFCCFVAQFGNLDYGWFGIAVIFIFHLFKDSKLKTTIAFSLLTITNYSILFIQTHANPYLIIIPCCILSLVPICMYNGLKGKNIKYFFYIFYPLHLFLLYVLHLFYYLKAGF